METSYPATVPMFRCAVEERLTFVVKAREGRLQLVRSTLAAAERSVDRLHALGYEDAHVHIGARRGAR